MKKILSLILITAFISSCSVDFDWNKEKKIQELEKKIVELETEKKDNLSERKKNCINTDLQKMFKNAQDYNRKNFGFFYSNNLNSCLWWYQKFTTYDDNVTYKIDDIWNGKSIFSSKNESEFLSEIEKLKL